MHRSRFTRQLLPAAVTLGLLAWVMTRVTPAELLAAAAELNWQLLLPATATMVVALYLWDAFCLPAVYRVDNRPFGYGKSLHLRGLSYLGGALNYELGQAALAWGMARAQHTGLVRMLTRSVLLAYHDMVVLLAAGFVGSLLSDDARVARIRPFIAVGLVVALAIGVAFWTIGSRVPLRFRSARAGKLLAGWSVGRSCRLLSLRLVYFGILVIYATVALAICRINVDHRVVVSTVPLVLLAEGLPNLAGLGTRETSLLLLLDPDDPAPLLAMSLFWSTGMIVVRLVIGLAHLWGHQFLRGSHVEKPATEP